MAAHGMLEVLPPVLDSTSDQPPLFDGTTRLSINDMWPYAQRMWIFRNYKGLHDKIKLVPIDLQNRPAWYKEKVYPENKIYEISSKYFNLSDFQLVQEVFVQFL